MALLALFSFVGAVIIASLPVSVVHAEEDYRERYSVVGDSFSSGDGAPAYVDQNCRVSVAHSFAANFQALMSSELQTPHIWACTGSTTAELMNNHQDLALRLDGTTDKPVALVTMTVGGNDINFGGVLANCYYAVLATNALLPPSLFDLFGSQQSLRDQLATPACVNQDSKVESDLRALPAKLVNTYHSLRSAAPNAEFIVLAYPDILPRNPTADCDYLSPASTKWLMQKEVELNAAIQQAVNTVRAENTGRVMYYLNPPDGFSDHTACSDEPWINPVTPDAVNNARQYLASGGSYQANFMKNNQNTFMHPNAAGYEAWARYVYDHLPGS